MARLIEQLQSGELTTKDVERRIANLRTGLGERALLLQKLQKEQGDDKGEVALLTKTLEEYNSYCKANRKSQYIRKGIYTIEQVFSMLSQGKVKLAGGETVNTNSIRYKVFRDKGLTCVTCGLKGEYFAMEKDSKESEEIYHFNLYGINKQGKEILFTRDHIRPKSRGGTDALENQQTMCSVCNCAKGNTWDGEE